MRDQDGFTYHCIEITDANQLYKLKTAWRDLFSDCSYDSVFMSWEWVSQWWKHLGAGLPGAKERRLCIVAAYRANGKLVGIAPLYEVDSHCSKFGGRRLVPIGTMAEGHGMTEEPPVLLRRGEEKEAFQAILTHLTSKPAFTKWNHFDLSVISPVTCLKPNGTGNLIGRLSQKRRFSSGSEIVDLPDTWIAFRAGLSKSMRDNLAYYDKRLLKNGHAWAVRIITAPDEIKQAAALLCHFHTLRQKSERGVTHQSHIPTPTHCNLLTESFHLLAAQGMASIALLDIDGKTVAAQSFLKTTDTLTFYYSGFDSAWYDYSPLILLQAEVIKDAIDRKISRLNFFKYHELWKSRWGSREIFQMQEVSGFSPRPIAFLDFNYRAIHHRYLQLSGIPHAIHIGATILTILSVACIYGGYLHNASGRTMRTHAAISTAHKGHRSHGRHWGHWRHWRPQSPVLPH